MFGKYKVAHLLGITREHESQFRHVERELTKAGYICFAPAIYDFDVYKQYPDLLDDMCYEKLLVCDLCVVVTPEHIGKSTTNRINQAISLNKPVYIWMDDKLMPYVSNGKTYQTDNYSSTELTLAVLSPVEYERAKTFREKHYQSCKNNRYIYDLEGTGIGTIVKIKCPVCGEEKNITDLDSW